MVILRNMYTDITLRISRNKLFQRCKSYQHTYKRYQNNNTSSKNRNYIQPAKAHIPNLFKSIIIIDNQTVFVPELLKNISFLFIIFFSHYQKFINNLQR